MIKVLLLFLFIGLNSYVEMQLQIIGGYHCKIEEYPFMVSIRHTGNFKRLCGGTLLSDLWILTAAHCCYKPTYNLTAVIGLSTVDVNNTPSENKRLIVEKVVHEIAFYNDICLVKMQSPITTNKNVQYVKLPSNADMDKDITDICKEGTVVGWGSQIPSSASISEKRDPHLRCVVINTLDKKTCQKRYPYSISISEMCAYTPNKDACRGDSGGPFMCNGFQYGIISKGIGCADEHPGIYVRVDMYLDFIRQHIPERSIVQYAKEIVGSSKSSCGQLHQLLHKRLAILMSLFYVTLKIK